jgi:hypothetical protein
VALTCISSHSTSVHGLRRLVALLSGTPLLETLVSSTLVTSQNKFIGEVAAPVSLPDLHSLHLRIPSCKITNLVCIISCPSEDLRILVSGKPRAIAYTEFIDYVLIFWFYATNGQQFPSGRIYWMDSESIFETKRDSRSDVYTPRIRFVIPFNL